MPNIRAGKMKSFQDLQAGITPMVPGQPERIPWVWWDTITYTSGTTTQADFFQTVQTDNVLGNMQAAGQIPAPMFFDLYHLGVHFDLGPSGLAVAAAITTPLLGALNDITNLLEGKIELQVAQKSYFQSKVGLCPAGYGAHGVIGIAGTYTATDGDQVQQGTNGIPDLRNRNYFWGELTLPHNQNFLVRMNWSAAITLHNGNTAIVTYLDGYLYRRVL